MTAREYAAAWGGLLIGVLLMLIVVVIAALHERRRDRLIRPDDNQMVPHGDIPHVPGRGG